MIRFKQMKSLLRSNGLLAGSIFLFVCAPITRGDELRSGHRISQHEATRNASDTDSYTKLCDEVALTIEGNVNWTGSATRDADAALVVFKQELAKIDLGTAPAGLTGGAFDPEGFQVLVGNILAMDVDPYDFANNDKWNARNTGFNNEFRKGLHNKQVSE
jgi:hypothetical protein